MAKTNFENLKIYQLSEQLSDDVWKIVVEWNRLAQDTVGKQLIRSAAGRGSAQDHRRFLKIARGSLYETQHWLRGAYKRQLLNEEQVKKLKPVVDELAPKLNAYLRSIKTLDKKTEQLREQTKDQSSKTKVQF